MILCLFFRTLSWAVSILASRSYLNTLTELASFCHCSESYLSRIFKKRTGVNINIYVNKVRVEQSKNLLTRSHDSIADISSSVGFCDPNYFSRVFSQIIGISPTEFRRRFQE